MERRVAIVGAGVSGLTCGVLFAERGCHIAIFAKETGQQTTSGAAAALWFPYDAEPAKKVIRWALQTYKVLVDLSKNSRSGVSMIELRQFSRTRDIQIPQWAIRLGARQINRNKVLPAFTSGFMMNVPLMDTTIYLDYLAKRFLAAGGKINGGVRFEKLEAVSPEFHLVINFFGIRSKTIISAALVAF